MNKLITIYHGSKQIVEVPAYGLGRKNNGKTRDDGANQMYLDIQEEEFDGLYIQDILRGGISNDDPRIPRNISE